MIPRMLMFTLAISCLTTSNLPWFMDLTFQVPMQYCSLQHWTSSITSHIRTWVLLLFGSSSLYEDPKLFLEDMRTWITLGPTLLPGAMLSDPLRNIETKPIIPLSSCQNIGFGLFSPCPLPKAAKEPWYHTWLLNGVLCRDSGSEYRRLEQLVQFQSNQLKTFIQCFGPAAIIVSTGFSHPSSYLSLKTSGWGQKDRCWRCCLLQQ